MIKGTNPTLLNCTYIRPNKDNDYTEKFEVIYKTEDGEVRKSEEPAEADIYIVKPEFRDFSYNKPQERMERMDKIRVPISKIKEFIAKESGDFGKRIIDMSQAAKDYRITNQLYKWPYAFACDFQPEYYYMKNWYEKYQLKRPRLSLAFMDIETDLIDYQPNMDDIPNTAYAPVNLITVILEESKEAWTFVLRPREPSKNGRSDEEYKKRYALYQKQLASHQELLNNKENFIKKIHDEFDNTYGYLHYNIREYEREIDLIADTFRLINTRKPNFCLIWNMRFDIQYLYYRIRELGYDSSSIMCHPDFKVEDRRCSFKVDKSTYMLEKQYDYFFCSSYTMYICQMRLYASIRKSQHKLKSVKLNAIAERELKDKKVEYPEAANIVTFVYMDWLRFIIYNIKDVLLQLGIERKVKDVITYYMRSHQNLTPYNKIFKETHLLRNVREMYFNKEGWVQGNNINIIDDNISDEDKAFYGMDDEEDEKSSFKGAINAEPGWNGRVGMIINSIRSNNFFMNSMDWDMGAFYPSIKISSNMDPGTLLYKASFDNNEFISGEISNRSLNTKYVEKDKNGNIRSLDITGEAINTYVSGNILTMGYNYFNMPSVTDLMYMVERKMNVGM